MVREKSFSPMVPSRPCTLTADSKASSLMELLSSYQSKTSYRGVYGTNPIPIPTPIPFYNPIPVASQRVSDHTHSYRNSWQVPWKISTNPSERLTKSQPSSDLFIFFWPIPPTPTNLFLSQILLSKPTHCFFLLTYLTLWCKVKHTDFFLFFLLFLYCLQKWRENSRVHKRPTWDPHVAVQAEDLPWWNC